MEEQIISLHSQERWRRRRQELAAWIERDKPVREQKRVVRVDGTEVDLQLAKTLRLLWGAGISTEFSCAGVSMLDDPEDHSLYAYITLPASEPLARFISLAMRIMRHRLLVMYDPERERYDLSSFFIGHNRSFCRLMELCAERFAGSA